MSRNVSEKMTLDFRTEIRLAASACDKTNQPIGETLAAAL